VSPRSPSSRRPAGFLLRAAAATIDAALGFGLALALSSSLGAYFARRAVVALRIGEPGTWWHGPIPMALGIFGEVVYLLPLTLLVVLAVEPFLGTTVGKAILGLEVGGEVDEPVPRARLWVRWATKGAGFWGWTVALLSGSWQVAALATGAAAAVAVGTLPALGPGRAALHDRITGTSVLRRKSAPRLVHPC
jgi:hypothetical protein